jgi:hypothetical protein
VFTLLVEILAIPRVGAVSCQASVVSDTLPYLHRGDLRRAGDLELLEIDFYKTEVQVVLTIEAA